MYRCIIFLLTEEIALTCCTETGPTHQEIPKMMDALMIRDRQTHFTVNLDTSSIENPNPGFLGEGEG